MFDCLAHEHAVKRILVEQRKTRQMERASLVERKACKIVPSSLSRDKRLWSIR